MGRFEISVTFFKHITDVFWIVLMIILTDFSKAMKAIGMYSDIMVTGNNRTGRCHCIDHPQSGVSLSSWGLP